MKKLKEFNKARKIKFDDFKKNVCNFDADMQIK